MKNKSSELIREMITIVPVATSQSLSASLNERIYSNQVIIHEQEDLGDSELPMPWDASAEIVGDKLRISGAAGPSGWGSATVDLPLATLGAIVILFQIDYHENNRQEDALTFADVREILGAGWKVFHGENTDHPFDPNEVEAEEASAKASGHRQSVRLNLQDLAGRCEQLASRDQVNFALSKAIELLSALKRLSEIL